MSSSQPSVCLVPEYFCLAITGPDARKIANNLTTNDIDRLEVGSSCETFVTNVKGWSVAHGVMACLASENEDAQTFWLVGQHPDPQSVAEHIDRYIFREDAEVKDLTSDRSLLAAFHAPEISRLGTGAIRIGPAWSEEVAYYVYDLKIDEATVAASGLESISHSEFDLMRIRSGWPLQNAELHEKTIPQEMDRDAMAISFNKGCYLGQETIARLDALGQLQRKLCVLTCESESEVAIGNDIVRDSKTIGSVSSLARYEEGYVALAVLKRGNFKPGTEVAIQGEKWVVSQPLNRP